MGAIGEGAVVLAGLKGILAFCSEKSLSEVRASLLSKMHSISNF